MEEEAAARVQAAAAASESAAAAAGAARLAAVRAELEVQVAALREERDALDRELRQMQEQFRCASGLICMLYGQTHGRLTSIDRVGVRCMMVVSPVQSVVRADGQLRGDYMPPCPQCLHCREYQAQKASEVSGLEQRIRAYILQPGAAEREGRGAEGPATSQQGPGRQVGVTCSLPHHQQTTRSYRSTLNSTR